MAPRTETASARSRALASDRSSACRSDLQKDRASAGPWAFRSARRTAQRSVRASDSSAPRWDRQRPRARRLVFVSDSWSASAWDWASEPASATGSEIATAPATDSATVHRSATATARRSAPDLARSTATATGRATEKASGSSSVQASELMTVQMSEDSSAAAMDSAWAAWTDPWASASAPRSARSNSGTAGTSGPRCLPARRQSSTRVVEHHHARVIARHIHRRAVSGRARHVDDLQRAERHDTRPGRRRP